MCGIVGFIDWSGAITPSDVVKNMNTAQLHRGPNSQNIFNGETFSFGSARLSIIDLNERSSMPMISQDGNHVLIFNGEIYNFQTLKSDLQARGQTFQTTSDTEVLLQLLALEGASCIPKLDGMFTFAYFNNIKGEILIARDRIGMKPLYYVETKDHFIFSSEQKSILKAETESLTISEQGLSDILNIGYNYGSTTLFTEMKCLLPGHYLGIKVAQPGYTDNIFHDILHNFNKTTWNSRLKSKPGDIEAELEKDILNSVEKHTVSDAPMGVICSGGVDSSLLAVFAHRFRPDIELYHASITGGINEQPYAQKVADKIQTSLNVAHIEKNIYMENWAKCIYHNDAPSYHPNDIPLYMVCQLAQSQNKKVLISGEGADELFGGYSVNRELKKRLLGRSLLEKIPGRIVSELKGMFESYFQRNFSAEYQNIMNLMGISSSGRIEGFLYSQSLIYSKMERFIKTSEILKASSFLNNKEQIISGYMTERLFSHLNTLLMRNDKMGMAASIETRIPFLSNTLLDKWVCMPSKFKIDGSRHQHLKYLLKKIAAKYLPREILYRPKVGFSIPLTEYININSNFLKDGYLQDYFKLKDNMLSCLYYDANTFYKIASLEIWCQLFLLKASTQQVQTKINTLLIN